MEDIYRAGGARPVMAVLCCGRTIDGRRHQMVAERFLEPLARSGCSALIVPSMPSVVDAISVASRCDGLLMTGSCSNVAPFRSGMPGTRGYTDEDRDHVALAVAEAMISKGRPVLGICRGLHELNVLHGGAVSDLEDDGVHMDGRDWSRPEVLDHRHDVLLVDGGVLREMSDAPAHAVFSAHSQGVTRLGTGLRVEAVAPDGLVEAFSAGGDGRIMGVQWHAEIGRSQMDAAIFARFALAA